MFPSAADQVVSHYLMMAKSSVSRLNRLARTLLWVDRFLASRPPPLGSFQIAVAFAQARKDKINR
jgi:hypothetical protein